MKLEDEQKYEHKVDELAELQREKKRLEERLVEVKRLIMQEKTLNRVRGDLRSLVKKV